MNFLESLDRQSVHDSELEELEIKLNTADMQGKKKCIRCGYCCHTRACIPTPDEFLKICEYLKMGAEDAFKENFVIDHYNSYDSIKFIFPVAKDQTPGKLLSSDETFTTAGCIFLNDNKCKIYKVRPAHAKETKCWDNPKDSIVRAIRSWADIDFLELVGYDINDGDWHER